jgi:hypothetical protein
VPGSLTAERQSADWHRRGRDRSTAHRRATAYARDEIRTITSTSSGCRRRSGWSGTRGGVVSRRERRKNRVAQFSSAQTTASPPGLLRSSSLICRAAEESLFP